MGRLFLGDIVRNRIFLLLVLTVSVIVLSCKERIELGSDLNNGSISNIQLTYTFKKYEGKNSVQDLINFMYFQGDTICFRFNPPDYNTKSSIKAWFVNPSTGKAYPAERIDMHDDGYTGFSLVGSIMEKFKRKILKNKIPVKSFCCKEIPFIIRVVYNNKLFEKKGSFIIRYLD